MTTAHADPAAARAETHDDQCTQPGCTGTIVDGYCDVCGSPPARRQRRARPSQPPGRRQPDRSRPAPAGRTAARRCPSGRRPAVQAGARPPDARAASPAAPAPSSTATATSAALPGRRPAGRAGRRVGRSTAVRSAGVGVDHHPRVEPARLDRARLQPGPGQRLQDHPAGALGLAAAALGPARRRSDPGAAGAGDRRRAGDHEEPAGPGGQADLPDLRRAGRPVPRRPARPGRGLLRQVRQPRTRSPRSCKAGRPGRQPVRGGRLPGPRRPGLDLPGPGPERVRPLGGAQGPAQHRRRGRAGRGHRRAAVPGPGRAPADRRDLQLRHPRRAPATS